MSSEDNFKLIMSELATCFPSGSKVRKRGKNLWGGILDVYLCLNVQKGKYDPAHSFFLNWGAIPISLVGRDPSGIKGRHPSYLVGTMRGRIRPASGQTWRFPEDEMMCAFLTEIKKRVETFVTTEVLPFAHLDGQIRLLQESRLEDDKARLALLQKSK
ncbi:MAG: hypothetical protein ABJN14_12915 [Paracoccaceae bacterium]